MVGETISNYKVLEKIGREVWARSSWLTSPLWIAKLR